MPLVVAASIAVHVVDAAPRDAGRRSGVVEELTTVDIRTGEVGGDDVAANVVVAVDVVVSINPVAAVNTDADVPQTGVAELVDVEFE